MYRPRKSGTPALNLHVVQAVAAQPSLHAGSCERKSWRPPAVTYDAFPQAAAAQPGAAAESVLTQAREVVQLYRSPGLSTSAGAALLRKAQAKVSGDIVDVDSELARPRVISRKNMDGDVPAGSLRALCLACVHGQRCCMTQVIVLGTTCFAEA